VTYDNDLAIVNLFSIRLSPPEFTVKFVIFEIPDTSVLITVALYLGSI